MKPREVSVIFIEHAKMRQIFAKSVSKYQWPNLGIFGAYKYEPHAVRRRHDIHGLGDYLRKMAGFQLRNLALIQRVCRMNA